MCGPAEAKPPCLEQQGSQAVPPFLGLVTAAADRHGTVRLIPLLWAENRPENATHPVTRVKPWHCSSALGYFWNPLPEADMKDNIQTALVHAFFSPETDKNVEEHRSSPGIKFQRTKATNCTLVRR